MARVTREKAKWGRKVAETERDLLLPVLAADTTVALNGKIYGKPADEKEAFEFLKDFSGQTHEVLTAVCLVDKEGNPRETLTKTFVTFRRSPTKKSTPTLPPEKLLIRPAVTGFRD